MFPPDVNTPGFERENMLKPKECEIISGNVKLMEPEEIAIDLAEGIIKNKIYITPGKASFYWWIKRHLPNLTLKIANKELKKARKQIGKL